MPSLRDLRRRIKGVQNMRKITKAMELVAAARMRRAQERVLAARPYSDEIASVMTELMRRSPQYEHPFLKVNEVQKRLIILVTADRGLAGALNSNNTRLALSDAAKTGVPVSYVTIGRRGRDVLRRLHRDLIADQSMLGDRPTMGDVLPAARVALAQYEAGAGRRVAGRSGGDGTVRAGRRAADRHRVRAFHQRRSPADHAATRDSCGSA